jgi:conjugative transfer signal peptidase TraF
MAKEPGLVLAIGLVAMMSLAAGQHSATPRIVYNPTESAPRGWYAIVRTDELADDNFALAHLPAAAATLADVRRYLPRSVPILKRVAAGPGQRVCELAGAVVVNGKAAARALDSDSHDRTLTPWSGCRTLQADEYFLLSRNSPASFDSRYFGPIRRANVIGRAVPLWTW